MHRIVLLVATFATLAFAGCQAPPAPPVPTTAPTAQPAPTAAPTATRPPATATPAPSPTSPPTAAPKAPTPMAAATRAPAASPGAGLPADSMGSIFADALPTMMAEAMPTMMAEAMPTLLAILPTAPPAPTGNSVTLSQADLSGRWEGWITIEAVTLTGASAEEQKACDDQLKVIKGRQIPTAMDFSPQSATAGTVKVITEQDPQGESQEDPIPYTYRSGAIEIVVPQGSDGTGSFEGKTIQTATGPAMTGTWKSEGNVDPTGGSSGSNGVISGTWVMRKSR